MKKSQGLNNAFQLLDGHLYFLENNTGLTVDPDNDEFILNPDFVLANNRHVIGRTGQESQPNNDATTEGQSLLVIGCAYAYMATNNKKWLEHAEKYWQAYVDVFYGGEPIPDPPAKYRCNWIVNGKQPVLAHYPLTDDGYPTHGGFKGVKLTWTNGQTKIPHGAPYYGEYLDKVWFAFDGNLGWNSVNATVYKENADGSTNWDEDGVEYPVAWIIDRLGRKVDWDGNILATGFSTEDYGTVQLQNTTLSGEHKFNFAVCLPVELGGYMLQRNEMWHNRPVNVPVEYGFADNASDAECWWCDANYILYELTGERKYWLCYMSSLITIRGYTDIDQFDKFFRQSKSARIPFTDGISYDYTVPSGRTPVYGRTPEGYISIQQAAGVRTYLEQQAISFGIDKDSSVVCTYGGLDTSGKPLDIVAELELSKDKDSNNTTLWRIPLPNPTGTVTKHTIPVTDLIRTKANNPVFNDPYVIADLRAISDWGSNCTVTMTYQRNILNTLHDKVADIVMDGDSGVTIGAWLTDEGNFQLRSITFRTFSDAFKITLYDNNNWRWYTILPANYGAWQKIDFSSSSWLIDSYQPEHTDDEKRPSAIDPSLRVEQFNIVTLGDPSEGDTAEIMWYCINELPETYVVDTSKPDYTMYFRISFKSEESSYTAYLGDCTIENYGSSGLKYCPGVIPFSNISDPNTAQYDGWRGIPYPGYQYPFLWCSEDTVDWVRLTNQINFLYDAQQWWYDTFAKKSGGLAGPMAQAFCWDRWDAHKYGDPDSFIMTHWKEKAWDGYEARAFYCACRGLQQLVVKKQTVPDKLVTVCKRWVDYLYDFQNKNGGRTPTIFYPDGRVEGPEDDFTCHMTALFLAGCCALGLAGYRETIPHIDPVIEKCMKQLTTNYHVIGPKNPMNGSWSYAPEQGVFFGFHAGELLRALSLYIMYRRVNSGMTLDKKVVGLLTSQDLAQLVTQAGEDLGGYWYTM